MRIEITYHWRYKWGGRWVTSRTPTSEEQIRKQYPEAIPVEGSRQQKLILDQVAEIDYACGACPTRRAEEAQHPAVLHWPCDILGHKGEIPLPSPAAEYSVLETDGVWTVTRAGKHPREVYRGPGPVRVEATP